MTEKTYFKTAVILFIKAFILISPLHACTSFAVYGKKNLYGMNFDYSDVELRFNISHSNGKKVFFIHFIADKVATQCSFIFDPELNEVFIMLKRDFIKFGKYQLPMKRLKLTAVSTGMTKLLLIQTG